MKTVGSSEPDLNRGSVREMHATPATLAVVRAEHANRLGPLKDVRLWITLAVFAVIVLVIGSGQRGSRGVENGAMAMLLVAATLLAVLVPMHLFRRWQLGRDLERGLVMESVGETEVVSRPRSHRLILPDGRNLSLTIPMAITLLKHARRRVGATREGPHWGVLTHFTVVYTPAAGLILEVRDSTNRIVYRHGARTQQHRNARKR